MPVALSSVFLLKQSKEVRLMEIKKLLRCLLSWISFGVVVIILIGICSASFLKEKYSGLRIMKGGKNSSKKN